MVAVFPAPGRVSGVAGAGGRGVGRTLAGDFHRGLCTPVAPVAVTVVQSRFLHNGRVSDRAFPLAHSKARTKMQRPA